MTSLLMYFYLKERWLNHRAAPPGCSCRWGAEKTQTAKQAKKFERFYGSGNLPLCFFYACILLLGARSIFDRCVFWGL